MRINLIIKSIFQEPYLHSPTIFEMNSTEVFDDVQYFFRTQCNFVVVLLL